MFDLITIKELAKELHKPESTIRTWKQRGELPPEIFKTIGGTIFVRAEKFREWVDSDT